MKQHGQSMVPINRCNHEEASIQAIRSQFLSELRTENRKKASISTLERRFLSEGIFVHKWKKIITRANYLLGFAIIGCSINYMNSARLRKIKYIFTSRPVSGN